MCSGCTYKNRVRKTDFFFEIPSLLSWEQGNPAENRAGKIQNIYVILNFPTLDFLICKIKERELQKYFCRSLPHFFTYPDHAQLVMLIGRILLTALFSTKLKTLFR